MEKIMSDIVTQTITFWKEKSGKKMSYEQALRMIAKNSVFSKCCRSGLRQRIRKSVKTNQVAPIGLMGEKMNPLPYLFLSTLARSPPAATCPFPKNVYFTNNQHKETNHEKKQNP